MQCEESGESITGNFLRVTQFTIAIVTCKEAR
jgi:hypothetical protein